MQPRGFGRPRQPWQPMRGRQEMRPGEFPASGRRGGRVVVGMARRQQHQFTRLTFDRTPRMTEAPNTGDGAKQQPVVSAAPALTAVARTRDEMPGADRLLGQHALGLPTALHLAMIDPLGHVSEQSGVDCTQLVVSEILALQRGDILDNLLRPRRTDQRTGDVTAP